MNSGTPPHRSSQNGTTRTTAWLAVKFKRPKFADFCASTVWSSRIHLFSCRKELRKTATIKSGQVQSSPYLDSSIPLLTFTQRPEPNFGSRCIGKCFHRSSSWTHPPWVCHPLAAARKCSWPWRCPQHQANRRPRCHQTWQGKNECFQWGNGGFNARMVRSFFTTYVSGCFTLVEWMLEWKMELSMRKPSI